MLTVSKNSKMKLSILLIGIFLIGCGTIKYRKNDNNIGRRLTNRISIASEIESDLVSKNDTLISIHHLSLQYRDQFDNIYYLSKTNDSITIQNLIPDKSKWEIRSSKIAINQGHNVFDFKTISNLEECNIPDKIITHGNILIKIWIHNQLYFSSVLTENEFNELPNCSSVKFFELLQKVILE